MALTGQAIASSKPYEPKVQPSSCVRGDWRGASYATDAKCVEPIQKGYTTGIVLTVNLIVYGSSPYIKRKVSAVISPTQGYTPPDSFSIEIIYTDRDSARWVR